MTKHAIDYGALRHTALSLSTACSHETCRPRDCAFGHACNLRVAAILLRPTRWDRPSNCIKSSDAAGHTCAPVSVAAFSILLHRAVVDPLGRSRWDVRQDRHCRCSDRELTHGGARFLKRKSTSRLNRADRLRGRLDQRTTFQIAL
jgi:hypothetical protein